MQKSPSERCLWDYAEDIRMEAQEERSEDTVLLALEMEQAAKPGRAVSL